MGRHERDSKARETGGERDSSNSLPDDSTNREAEDTNLRDKVSTGDDGGDAGGVVLDRRSYLIAASAATAAIAGCASTPNGDGAEIQAVSGFGYGGASVLQQPSSIEVSTTESEPNDDQQEAQVIEFGSTVSGSLTQADVDWFAFDVNSGEEITVTLDRSASDGVTAVVLYDTNGEFANLRYVGTDGPITFSKPAAESGTHFLQVVDTQSSDGDYTLTVAPEGSDQTETPTPTPTATPTPTPTPTATPTPTPTPDDGQSPYNGEAASIPGRIQAEDFDVGGEGVAYHDSDGNSWGVYRTDEAVDIQETTDTGSGYNVGWIYDGEWLEYTASVSSGTYDVHFRVASPTSDGSMQIAASLDGSELGSVDVPDTGDWQNWETVTLSDVTIDSDQTSVLRLDFISGSFNLNWVEFEQTSSTATPTPTETETITPTPTSDDDYGEQRFGDDGYGGVS